MVCEQERSQHDRFDSETSVVCLITPAENNSLVIRKVSC